MHILADRPGFFLAIWIVVNLFGVGIYDLAVLLLFSGQYRTVSSYLSEWAGMFPLGVLFAGVIIGHLIWPSDSRPR